MAAKKASGISYARAAKKFGVDIETVKNYAQMVKEYRREALRWGREHHVANVWVGHGLAAIAKSKDAAAFFRFQQREIESRMQEGIRERLNEKLSQYLANIISAVSKMPGAYDDESPESIFLEGVKNGDITEKMILDAVGGDFFQRIGGKYKRKGAGAETASEPEYDITPIEDILETAGLL